MVGRPRNPKVEEAWSVYAAAYEDWQRLLNASTIATMAPNFSRELDARAKALKIKSDAKDVALFEYFEIYDRDQREAFSG